MKNSDLSMNLFPLRIDQKNWLPITILGLFVFVIIFQFLSLNFPALNGDEALYLLLNEQITKLRSGGGIDLNPIIGYSGPIQFWILGSVYELCKYLPISPEAWMVRVLPLVFFVLSTLSVFNELKNWSRTHAYWYLFATICMPMGLVYSRVAWPHTIAFPACIYLLSEALRIERTQTVRWFRIAIIAGIACESHPISFLGLLVIFVPVLGKLFKSLRREWGRCLFSVLIYLTLTYPVLRNFPPPISTGQKGSLWLQFRSLVNIVTGVQPFDYFLKYDPASSIVHIGILIFFIFIFWKQFRQIFHSQDKFDKLLRYFWMTHVTMAIYLVFAATRGRDLTMFGNERYFLSITPGWILLQSDAFERFFKQYLPTYQKKLISIFILFCLIFGRFGWKIWNSRNETDPNLVTTQWLIKSCPKDRCVVYADNFWNYWPIRYYSRDVIDINSIRENWKESTKHLPGNRQILICWQYSSSESRSSQLQNYPGIQDFQVFPAQKTGLGNVCYFTNTPPVR